MELNRAISSNTISEFVVTLLSLNIRVPAALESLYQLNLRLHPSLARVVTKSEVLVTN